MKRPLFTVGCSFLTGMAVALFLPQNCLLPAMGLLPLLAGAALWLARSRRMAVVLLSLAAAAGEWFLFCQLQEPLPAAGPVEFRGYVVTSSLTDAGEASYDVRGTLALPEGERRARLRLYTSQVERQFGGGDGVAASVTLFAREDPAEERYLRGDGLDAAAFAIHMESAEVHGGFLQGVAAYRQQIRDGLEEILPPQQAAGVMAMATGDREGMDPAAEDALARSGLIHLAAVSGMHLSVLAGIFLRLAGPRAARSKWVLFLALGMMVAFSALAFFTGSVLRSAVMTAVYLLAGVLGRSHDAKSAMGLSALLLCAANPYAACDLGLWLSLLATLGILELAAPLEGWLRRRIFGGEGRLERFLASALACTLAATLFTMPLQAVFFGYFSLVSPLANLLAAPVADFTLLASLAGSLLLPVLGVMPLTALLARAAALGYTILVQIAQWTASLPGAVFQTASLWRLFAVLACCGAGILLVYRPALRQYRRLMALGAANLLLLGALAEVLLTPSLVRAVYFKEERTLLLAHEEQAVILCPGQELYASRRMLELMDRLEAGRIAALYTEEEAPSAAVISLCRQAGAENLLVPLESAFAYEPLGGALYAVEYAEGEYFGGLRIRREGEGTYFIETKNGHSLKYFPEYVIINWNTPPGRWEGLLSALLAPRLSARYDADAAVLWLKGG